MGHRLARTLLGFAAVVLAPRTAGADDPHDPETLFSEGLALIEAEQYTAALTKLEEAQRRDPGIGTEFNIAICYEKLGKIGSAWHHYANVERLAHTSGKRQREEHAHQKLEELRPQLSTFVFVPAKTDKLLLKVDGNPIPPEQWGFYPVDPGTHQVAAEAPSHTPWAAEVEAPSPGDRLEIPVPALRSPEPTKVVTVTKDTTSGTRTVGLVLGGIGVAGLVAASVTGIMILDDMAIADASCKPKCINPDGSPNERAIDAVNEGKTLLPLNLVAWAIAVVGLGSGAYLVLTSSKKPEERRARLAPMIGATTSGLVLSWPRSL
jgi:hypothetical protein